MELILRRRAPWLIGGAVALSLLVVRGAPWVSAANTPLAYVDAQRVIAEYKQAAEYAKSLNSFRNELQKPLDELQMGMLLDDGQRNDLKTLLAKASLTPAEQAKLNALKKQNEDNAAELRRLEALPTPSEQERKRRTELINRVNDQNAKAAALNDRLSRQFADRQREMDNKVRAEIQAAIDAVATQQAIEIVLDKEAVLHGGQDKDITDAVVAKLNSAAPK